MIGKLGEKYISNGMREMGQSDGKRALDSAAGGAAIRLVRAEAGG